MYRPGPPGWASVLSMTTDAANTAPEPEKSMRERMLAGEVSVQDMEPELRRLLEDERIPDAPAAGQAAPQPDDAAGHAPRTPEGRV